MLRIVAIVTITACLVAQGSVAVARTGDQPPGSGAAATSLHIAYYTRDFKLHYTLRCDPASGTLPRAEAACAAIARAPIMVHGEPPEPPGTAIRSCPPPRETIQVTGTYEGAPATAYGDDTCGAWHVLDDWQPFLPSAESLEVVRVNRGAGPLRLGEHRSTVRSLLGAPTKTISGADVYVNEGAALSVPANSGQISGMIREMFAVGYGRHGNVTTIISNWLVNTGPERSSPLLSHPHRVHCAGRTSAASRALDAPGPTTILWPSAGYTTVIVTRASGAACRLARASEQRAVNSI